MIQLILLGIVFIIVCVFSCISFDKGVSFRAPDVIAIYSGLLALYALIKEYRNRNSDINRMFFIQPILDLLPEIETVLEHVDIISKITIHQGQDSVKAALDQAQQKMTNLSMKLGTRLRKIDTHYSTKNKEDIDDFFENKIFPPFVHLSQNLPSTEQNRKVFSKDILELQGNISSLMEKINALIKKISDKS